MKIRKLLFYSMLWPLLLSAQDEQTIGSRFINDGSALVNTFTHTMVRPFHWDSENFKTLGYVAAGAGVLYIFDEQIGDWIKNQRSPFLDQLHDVGDWGGKPVTATGLSMAFFFYGVTTGNEWSRDTGILMGSTMAVAGLIQTASKTVFGRARPAAKKGNNTYHPFPNSSRYHSFPSGHTTVALTWALVLGHQIDSDIVKYGLYGLSGVTMWSRLYSNAHWASDVFLGAALSYAAFQSNLYFYKKLKSDKIGYLITPTNNGIQFSLLF
ncbi:MAG: phosphatase PAP2 family protein [Calditrichae bacterium]|nr:phosphatase PAP2 family protein [Calditrichota bacterium]MCB9058342.1 phosphatase PAP2 family protein [Calditrichia bacterium]